MRIFWRAAASSAAMLGFASACNGSISLGSAAPGASAEADSSATGSSSGEGIDSGTFLDASVAQEASSEGSASTATGPHGGSPSDAAPDLDALQPAPTGLAGFAFVANGVEQTPLSCLTEDWEYPPPPPQAGHGEGGLYGDTVCNNGVAPCPGMSVFLVNTSQFPLAYTAQTTWGGSGEPPGVQFGLEGELSGVLDPGGEVDITSVYVGGLTAVLGSSHPFVDPDAGKYVADGATIPWPAGVAGSDGASQMYVAEINIVDACRLPSAFW